jgi:hypothetical protein
VSTTTSTSAVRQDAAKKNQGIGDGDDFAPVYGGALWCPGGENAREQAAVGYLVCAPDGRAQLEVRGIGGAIVSRSGVFNKEDRTLISVVYALPDEAEGWRGGGWDGVSWIVAGHGYQVQPSMPIMARPVVDRSKITRIWLFDELGGQCGAVDMGRGVVALEVGPEGVYVAREHASQRHLLLNRLESNGEVFVRQLECSVEEPWFALGVSGAPGHEVVILVSANALCASTPDKTYQADVGELITAGTSEAQSERMAGASIVGVAAGPQLGCAVVLNQHASGASFVMGVELEEARIDWVIASEDALLKGIQFRGVALLGEEYLVAAYGPFDSCVLAVGDREGRGRVLVKTRGRIEIGSAYCGDWIGVAPSGGLALTQAVSLQSGLPPAGYVVVDRFCKVVSKIAFD